jgi:hypothetical protein
MKRLAAVIVFLAVAGCHRDYTKAEFFGGFDHQAQIGPPVWCTLEATPNAGRTLFRLVHPYVAFPDWQAPAAEYLEFVLTYREIGMGKVFAMGECNAWSVASPYWIGRGQVTDGTIRVVRQGKAEIEIEISSPQLRPPITGVHLFKLSEGPPSELGKMLIQKTP